MRVTICQVAIEFTSGGFLWKFFDVYNYGVLLVLVSGRRPLQVTTSPEADFEWASLKLGIGLTLVSFLIR